MAATIYAFVKIFEKQEYAEDFMDGRLFMNTIRHFQRYKDKSGELRGDPYEGIIAMYQPSKFTQIRVDNIVIPSNEIATPVVVHGNELLNKNAFCIYSLNSRDLDANPMMSLHEFKQTIEIHDSCYGFGPYCVVVNNAEIFISKVSNGIKQAGYAGSLCLVDYFDENSFHGVLPPERHGYQKRSFFKYQQEYRVLIDTRRAEPKELILDVGSLRDITSLVSTDQFNSLLEIKSLDDSKE